MEYVVFDLEWNQSPNGNAGSHPRMPFEIIEIGAVKLNENFEVIDRFRQLIRPRIYPKLQWAIKEILSYDEKDLKRDGVPFKEACTEFLKWCGEDYRFCTWGNMDVYYLQNNMDFYNMPRLPYPLRYYDIQKLYAERCTDNHNICKLEKAIEHLELEENMPFHTAQNDAEYTGMVMRHASLGNIRDHYSIDLYRHPKKKSETICDLHGGVCDEIFGEYPSRMAAMSDEDVTSVRCVRCGRKTSKRIKWFQANNSVEYAVGRCMLHGNMKATLKIKSVGDSTDNVYVIKKTEPCNRESIESVKGKHKAAIARKKRHDKNKAKQGA